MRIDQLFPALRKGLKTRKPIFIWGPPGVGKSAAVKAFAISMGLDFRDWRTALAEPTDIKGFPAPDMKKKVMEWLQDKLLPTEGKGILFLDELSAAPTAVQAALYQLILDGRIGEYILPKGWYIVAAGNDATHRAVTHRMPSPLANRFTHLFVESDFEAFRKWAFDNGIHVNVIAYLSLRPDALYDFDPTVNPLAFGTGRSWASLNEFYTCDEEVDPEIDLALYAGTVGQGRAAEFVGFLKMLDQVPDPDKIIKKPLEAVVPTEPSARYAVTAALAARVTAKNYEQLMLYITRLPVEFQVLFNRSALRKDEGCADTRAFQKWSIENDNVLT